MVAGYRRYRPKLDLRDGRTGDPEQTEREPAGTVSEAIARRTVRQAILTQLLTEVADEIIQSGATVTVYKEDRSVLKPGDLGARYNKGEFPRLHALIENPEASFNMRRNRVFAVENPDDPSFRLDFGSINLVVFRSAMAIGEKDVDPEEVAKRVVIRAGRSSGYGERAEDFRKITEGRENSKGYADHGFAGCK